MEQLAEDGDVYAQYIIGTAYRNGGLLIPDAAKAQKLLGKLHLTGEGVQQDTDAAYQWFTKAYYGGHTYAGMFMDRIDRKRLAQLRQKRIALGHKPDDHELEPQGYTMQFH